MSRDQRERYAQLCGQRDMLTKLQQERIDSHAKKTAYLVGVEDAAGIVQDVAKKTQENIRGHIETIVELALDTCFPDTYSFLLEFETKHGRTDAGIYLLRNGERIDPMESTGGGVVDILTFALRIACWTLSKTDNVIILDEPFKFLSAGLRPMAGEILQKISHKLEIQFILVTHDESIIDAADRIFEVTQSEGVSAISVRDANQINLAI